MFGELVEILGKEIPSAVIKLIGARELYRCSKEFTIMKNSYYQKIHLKK